MKKYIIRLDDAAEKMNIDNWEKWKIFWTGMILSHW